MSSVNVVEFLEAVANPRVKPSTDKVYISTQTIRMMMNKKLVRLKQSKIIIKSWQAFASIHIEAPSSGLREILI